MNPRLTKKQIEQIRTANQIGARNLNEWGFPKNSLYQFVGYFTHNGVKASWYLHHHWL
tara:strand:+ start:986 stop:1159 length:174 start_codon:yes stop_codon:yes gene_type:complete